MQFSIYRMYTLKKPFSRVVDGVIGVIHKGKENINKRYSQVREGNRVGKLFFEHFLLCDREAIQVELP